MRYTAMPRVIWLARHANRQDFVDDDWAKTAEQPHNPGLSADGIEQAKQLARRLIETDIDRIVASPFLRTVETAHAVAEALDRSVLIEPGFGEWLNAEWFAERPALLTPDALTDRFECIDPSHSPCLTPSFPETRAAMLARIAEAVRCVVRRYDDARELLLVGHSATLEGAFHALMDDAAYEGCPLAGLTRLVHKSGTWQITLCNDITHLDRNAAPTATGNAPVGKAWTEGNEAMHRADRGTLAQYAPRHTPVTPRSGTPASP